MMGILFSAAIFLIISIFLLGLFLCFYLVLSPKETQIELADNKITDKFKNSPIHDKKAIIELMDELEPKEMIEVVDFIKSKTNKITEVTNEK